MTEDTTTDLTARLDAIRRDRLRLAEQLAAAKREIAHLTANVTALQTDANHALVCSRLDRVLTSRPELMAALLDLAWGIEIARAKHPEGSDLTSLVSEVGEVATAMDRETPARVRAELLDVAVVAMRMRLDDGKPSRGAEDGPGTADVPPDGSEVVRGGAERSEGECGARRITNGGPPMGIYLGVGSASREVRPDEYVRIVPGVRSDGAASTPNSPKIPDSSNSSESPNSSPEVA